MKPTFSLFSQGNFTMNFSFSMFKIIAPHDQMNFNVRLCFSIELTLPFFFLKKPFGTFSRQKETQQHNQGSSWFLDTSEYRLVQSVGNQRKISNGEKTDIGSKTSSSTMFLQPQKPEAGHRPRTASKGGISTSVNRWGLAGNLLGRNHSRGS